jgi:two-component system, LytTR family, sensor kinase
LGHTGVAPQDPEAGAGDKGKQMGWRTGLKDLRRGDWTQFTLLIMLLWCLAGAFEFISFGSLNAGTDQRPDWRGILPNTAGYWGLTALFTPLLVWVNRRLPVGQGRKRWALTGHFFLLVGYIAVFGAVRWQWMEHTTWHYDVPFDAYLAAVPRIAANYMGDAILAYLVILGAVSMWDYYHRFQEKAQAAAALEIERAGLRASLSEARLEALQSQLQPHFLFNALHALSTLILDKETEAANDMVTQLSRFLRMTLDHANSPTIPLAVELQFLDAYLRIQKQRFRDRLQVRMEIDDRARPAGVPSLILQPLVENSIRHGIGLKPGAGLIAVRAVVEGARLRLEVQDDGRGLTRKGAGAEGTGLSNIRERLTRLYPEDHTFRLEDAPGGGTLAVIDIPYRPMEAEADVLAQ